MLLNLFSMLLVDVSAIFPKIFDHNNVFIPYTTKIIQKIVFRYDKNLLESLLVILVANLQVTQKLVLVLILRKRSRFDMCQVYTVVLRRFCDVTNRLRVILS